MYLSLRGRRTSRAMSVVFSILRASRDNRKPTRKRGSNFGETRSSNARLLFAGSVRTWFPDPLARQPFNEHDTPRQRNFAFTIARPPVNPREAKSLESSTRSRSTIYSSSRASERLPLIRFKILIDA